MSQVIRRWTDSEWCAECARLRTEGLSFVQTAKLLGITLGGVRSALRKVGRKIERPVIVYCCACGAEIARWSDLSRAMTNGLCLACLAKRPEATVPQRLRAYRIAAGLSTRQLAERVGASQWVVTTAETGASRPSRALLARLAVVLGPGVLPPGLTPDTGS
jgi:DNA-binding CsgD family transcriptional regulator